MMSDAVATGLQLPNLTTGQARNSSSGFVRLYFKNENLYGVNSSGSDKQLTGPGSLELANISNVNNSLNPTDNQVLAWDDANQYWTSVTVSGVGSGIALTDLSVGAEGTPAGDGSLEYDDTTGVFTYTPPVIPASLTDLNITDGTTGQVLTTNGAGTFTFETVSGGISEELAIAYSIALG